MKRCFTSWHVRMICGGGILGCALGDLSAHLLFGVPEPVQFYGYVGAVLGAIASAILMEPLGLYRRENVPHAYKL